MSHGRGHYFRADNCIKMQCFLILEHSKFIITKIKAIVCFRYKWRDAFILKFRLRTLLVEDHTTACRASLQGPLVLEVGSNEMRKTKMWHPSSGWGVSHLVSCAVALLTTRKEKKVM